MFVQSLIRPDGTEEAIGKKLTLQEMQKLVEGYIEPVRMIEDKLCLIVNEEGLMRNLPLNLKATRLVHRSVLHKGIRGNALIVTRSSM